MKVGYIHERKNTTTTTNAVLQVTYGMYANRLAQIPQYTKTAIISMTRRFNSTSNTFK
jgi:hypothetical protein